MTIIFSNKNIRLYIKQKYQFFILVTKGINQIIASLLKETKGIIWNVVVTTKTTLRVLISPTGKFNNDTESDKL